MVPANAAMKRETLHQRHHALRDPRRLDLLEVELHAPALELDLVEQVVDQAQQLLATVAENAHYHAYNSDDPIFSPRGKEEVRRFYTAFVGSGAHRLEFDCDRLIVDDDCALTEGTMRIAYPGSLLRFMGHEVDDPDAFYLYETRMAVVWPMDAHGLVIAYEGVWQRV